MRLQCVCVYVLGSLLFLGTTLHAQERPIDISTDGEWNKYLGYIKHTTLLGGAHGTKKRPRQPQLSAV